MNRHKKRASLKTGELQYKVDKILDVRIKSNGDREYLIKWLGYNDAENSWEPSKNLPDDLVHSFEAEKNRKKRAADQENGKGKKKTEAKKSHGFDRGLQAEKIIGATDSSGKLMFLMKWAGVDEADLVPAELCNSKCPQVVIKFYEERLTWHSNNAVAAEEAKAN